MFISKNNTPTLGIVSKEFSGIKNSWHLRAENRPDDFIAEVGPRIRRDRPQIMIKVFKTVSTHSHIKRIRPFKQFNCIFDLKVSTYLNYFEKLHL